MAYLKERKSSKILMLRSSFSFEFRQNFIHNFLLPLIRTIKKVPNTVRLNRKVEDFQGLEIFKQCLEFQI